MASAIQQLRGLTRGFVGLGQHGDGIGSIAQQVHDGDTITVRALGNFGIRFLGIDTPEISFGLPGAPDVFRSTGSAPWEQFLSDPFAAQWPAFPAPLDGALEAHLAARVGPGAATNHRRHAEAAQRALEHLIEQDAQAMGWADSAAVEFFLAFAREVTDGYGRFLAYVNRNQTDPVDPAPRPATYNERMLATGLASPYFIWPNVNPFRRQGSLLGSVPAPGTANDVAEGDSALRDARNAVRTARLNGIGIFDPADPLRLEPFELRFLARRTAPSRWVIALDGNDDLLLPPEHYPEIPNSEDRLFVPEEYVPLFVERGWHRA